MLFTQYDKEFLQELDKVRNKIIYARITALQFNETPIETIEGRVTGGSINIDGTSALRRTCSLTIVAQDFNYNDYYWGLNTKFKLEIGVKNPFSQSEKEDIIWFNQGIYLITDFSTSHSTSSFTISISGKDKMCLLNGDIGGAITAETDFGKIEEEDQNGNWTIQSIPIFDIIKNMVHVYAGEPYHNIIINDLDIFGLELLEYRYDVPMYLYRDANTEEQLFENATMLGDKICWVEGVQTTLKDLRKDQLDTLTENIVGNRVAAKVKFENTNDAKEYYVAKIEYGQTAGYRRTDLIYAGDLIGKVGESITSILDKIRNMLVEYEYFYNVEGQFVFQKKQSYIKTPWTPIAAAENGLPAVIESYYSASANSYTFSGGELITSFNNSPDLSNVRNDFSIWGQRTSISGTEIPVHMRYAIDKKPLSYKSFDGIQYLYGTQYNSELELNTIYCDWREIIYQMAKDYYQYNQLDDFELQLSRNNAPLYPNGQTGYEEYYTDIQGFWRELFNPELNDQIISNEKEIDTLNEDRISCTIIEKNENTNEYIAESSKNQRYSFNGFNKNYAIGDMVWLKFIRGSNKEEVELDTRGGVNKFKESIEMIENRLYNNSNLISQIWSWFTAPNDSGPNVDDIFESDDQVQKYYNSLEILTKRVNEDQQLLNSSVESLNNLINQNDNYLYRKENYYYGTNSDREYWNKTVFEQPEQLNFWFDFMDSDGEISKYNTKVIGFRPKSINETALKGIYFRETPSIIFITDTNDKYNEMISGYKYIKVADIDSMFSISSQGKSIKDKLDELLYQHSYCTENISVTAIPIYYLEPNTRIYIYDENTGLNNDYILNKITLSLNYNGMMNLTATKVVDNL